MAATLRDNCSTQTLFFNFPHGTTEQNGQTITPTESYVLETIKFYAKWKYGDPGTCYISLQATTAGLPNGSLLTDRASFTITADKALKSITFSTQPILQIGTKYAIVFEAPNGVASSGELHLYGNASSGNDYTGGDRVWYNGSDWATVTSQDLNFYCWGLPGLPGKPINPTPLDEASDVTLHSTTGTWESGGNTDSYRVLYGTLSGFLEEVGTTSDLSMVLVEGNFSVYGKISYWQVVAVNAQGTTASDEWYFTVMNFEPVLPTGISLDHSGGEGGVPTGTATGENNMITMRKLVAVAESKVWFEDI